MILALIGVAIGAFLSLWMLPHILMARDVAKAERRIRKVEKHG